MTEGERRLNAAITDPQYYIQTTHQQYISHYINTHTVRHFTFMLTFT